MPRIPNLFKNVKGSRIGLVETGFLLGGTIVQALEEGFSWYKGCEPSPKYFGIVQQRVSSNYYNLKNIEIKNCISTTFLENLDLQEPAVFWLDAHYSAGDTFKSKDPLFDELNIIKRKFSSLPHCILIDDSRGREGAVEREAMKLFGNCKFIADSFSPTDIAHIEISA